MYDKENVICMMRNVSGKQICFLCTEIEMTYTPVERCAMIVGDVILAYKAIAAWLLGLTLRLILRLFYSQTQDP